MKTLRTVITSSIIFNVQWTPTDYYCLQNNVVVNYISVIDQSSCKCYRYQSTPHWFLKARSGHVINFKCKYDDYIWLYDGLATAVPLSLLYVCFQGNHVCLKTRLPKLAMWSVHNLISHDVYNYMHLLFICWLKLGWQWKMNAVSFDYTTIEPHTWKLSRALTKDCITDLGCIGLK